MGRPKVAFVRGAALNPFETQVFSRDIGYDVRAVGCTPANYEVDLVPIPMTLLSSTASASRAARFGRRVGLPVDRWLGPQGHLHGLREAVRSADIIHSAETFIPLSEQCADVAADTGAKLVLTCWENIPFLHEDDPVMAPRKRKLRAAASLFVAVTAPARDALLAEGVDDERIRVVPAALDVDRFSTGHDPEFLTRRLDIPEGAKIVLFVGRMIREKGVAELVHAFAEVPFDAGHRPHLVCVGDGPELTRIRDETELLGLDGRVHLLPAQSYRDIPSVFRAADVVVVPSLSTPYWQEQFGFVLAEAMACARPVITTRTGSIPNVVGDAALLVPDYDREALTAAMAALLGDCHRAENLGAAGRMHVEQSYSSTAVGPALAAVYGEALASR